MTFYAGGVADAADVDVSDFSDSDGAKGGSGVKG